MCNNAVITNGTLRGQPTEGALVTAAMKVHTYIVIYDRLVKIIYKTIKIVFLKK